MVGENGCISPKGESILIEESQYYNYYGSATSYIGNGVADAAQQCKTELPLTSDPLKKSTKCLERNFSA